MTTRPHLETGLHLLRGTAAMLLFAVMAVTFLGLDLGDPAGFPEVDSITAVIGFALLDIPAAVVESTGTEPFLVALIIVGFVLDAALEGGLMLASREEAGEVVSALRGYEGGDDG
ncbi:MAG: hypothetical protein V5A23_08375 [Halobacteriales archaeon]